MTKYARLTAATLGLAVLSAPTAQADDLDPVATINAVTYAGSGCPANSASASLDGEYEAISLTFDKYTAEVGPGSKPSDGRKNCRITVDLRHAADYHYTIHTASVSGYLSLDKHVSATQQLDYSFAGEKGSATFWSNWQGPVAEDYLFTYDLVPEAMVWSPCGKEASLNANAQVKVDNSHNKAGSGLITTDTITGKVTMALGLTWQKCE